MKIVVIGGTGFIGSRLVTTLRENGHWAVAASPESGVDTVTGEDLPEVLEGAAVVVDVSAPPSCGNGAVAQCFAASTRNVLGYAAEAGVTHHVALSSVGAGRLVGERLFSSAARAGTAHPGIADSVFDRSRHAMLRVISGRSPVSRRSATPSTCRR